MHVLIIPSEEFVPGYDHTAGIFQKHQAQVLNSKGFRVGVLSVSQEYSVYMLLKIFFQRCKKVRGELSEKTPLQVLRLLYDKIFHVQKFILQEEVEGIPVVRISGFYFLPPSKHTNFWGWIRACEEAYLHYCQEYGTPDLIHSHNVVHAGLAAHRISKRQGVPFLITEHSSFIGRKLESKFLHRRICKAYLDANKVLVVSKFLGRKIHQHYSKRVLWEVLPNVLDPKIESVPFTNLTDQDKPFLFLAIGGLIPVKRHSDLIQAFSKAFSNSKEINLEIGGTGSLQEQLQGQVFDNGLDQKVNFLGKLNRMQVIEALDRCDCLVLSSEFETFGVVVIEALSRGKPVIVSACGGPEEIINLQSGFMYNLMDIDDLAEKMKKMVLARDSFNPQEIRRYAMSKFSGESFFLRLCKYYSEIAA